MYGFTNYLNSKLPLTTRVTYDAGNTAFFFDPYIDISPETDLAVYRLIGLPDGLEGRVPRSTRPVNFRGVTQIRVMSNLSVNNIPLSNILACIPVEVNYGETVIFKGKDTTQAVLCTNDLRIGLADQYGNPLSSYLNPDDPFMPNWHLILSIHTMDVPGGQTMLVSSDSVVEPLQTNQFL